MSNFFRLSVHHIKLYFTTLLAVAVVIVLVGTIGIPYLLDYVEKIYIQLQVDVNKRQAQNIAHFMYAQKYAGMSSMEILKGFQASILGTKLDKGYMCLIERKSNVFVCHPDSTKIGSTTGFKRNFVSADSLGGTPIEPAIVRQSLLPEGRGGVIVNDDKIAQIIYYLPIEQTPWVLAVHENAGRVAQELAMMRSYLLLGIVILGVVTIIVVSLVARYISGRYEQQIEDKNKILEEKAIEIHQANADLHKQNEQLVSLNIEKNEFMGIMAHDLKNPLGAMRELAELIQSGFIAVEQIPEVTAKIVSTANRMLELVKNLLDVNRLESGEVQFQRVEFDIAPLVESSVWQYQLQAKAKNITLHYSAEAISNLVIADEQAMMQVLDNILSNAIKYSPHGKNVFVRVNASNERVRVEVQDEGEGISPDDMTKLFGKFARLSARPTGGEHSTGLGLSIVKKMVEAMDGKVWCESEVGKGATFMVELPSAV